MKHTLEEAAKQELISSYACTSRILSFTGFLYNADAMLNMFFKGAEWHAKQSPWISVEDRLPEGNTGVFFTVEWNDIHKVGYFVGLYYEDGQWESERRIFLPNSSLVRVTHWMPIPKFDE